MDDEYILNKFFNSLNKINSHAIKHATKEELHYLNNRYNDSESIKETLNRIKYKINERPVCKICGKPVKFCGKQNNLYYATCSRECSHIFLSNLSKEKYAKLSDEQKKNSIIKHKQTCLEKYGDENYRNIEKHKLTCLEKYGVTSYTKTNECKEKIIQTNIERYGVKFAAYLNTNNFKTNNPQKNDNIKEKTKQTNIIKYGGVSPSCSKEVIRKQKQTCLKRYGKESYTQTQEYKNIYQDNFTYIQKKTKETCLKRYGVEYISQNVHISLKKQNTWKQKTKDEINNIIDKINNTKYLHNSFNISHQEEECYKLLNEKYPDIIRQYNDNRYPFNCDFYIPSLDLFIEFNGSQYHNKRPYLGTEEDIKEANKLLEKDKILCEERGCNHTQYKNIWHCWTIRDPKKRQIAKDNNLNYIEFWNLKEVKEWLNFN